MNRRTFLYGLTLGTLTAPGSAQAQQAGRLVRLGRLSLAELDAQPGRASTDAILDGLRDLGYEQGRDYFLERRDAGGNPARLHELVMDLVRLPVYVLLVTGVTATMAAHRATKTIPIVCMMGDPMDGQQLSRVALVQITENAAHLYETWVGVGVEGIVLKDPASRYWPGERSPAWLQLKPKLTLDVIVIGGAGHRISWGDWAMPPVSPVSSRGPEHESLPA